MQLRYPDVRVMVYKFHAFVKPLVIFSMALANVMNSYSQTPKKAETVTLNGSTIYYEVYGKGEPLFLLHGYTWSSRFWLPFISDYAMEYEVYVVDLKGHGKSGMFKEKLSIEAAASDVDALISHLQLSSIFAIGYSYGGDVLFQLALRHPGLIKSMVVVGSCGICDIKRFPQWIEFLSYKNRENLPWMRDNQTSEEQIRTILDQSVNYYASVSPEQFKSILAETLMVIGDQEDSILWEDILVAKNNLPRAHLWVIPNTGHRAHTDKNKAEFVRVTKDFFNGKWTK